MMTLRPNSGASDFPAAHETLPQSAPYASSKGIPALGPKLARARADLMSLRRREGAAPQSRIKGDTLQKPIYRGEYERGHGRNGLVFNVLTD